MPPKGCPGVRSTEMCVRLPIVLSSFSMCDLSMAAGTFEKLMVDIVVLLWYA